ncbi:MAG TPA: glycosyltransferase family 1 protein [Chloroflexia bacterium]|nr:glycosyltransferase family 1 protein [Chloroflexia bacterium]
MTGKLRIGFDARMVAYRQAGIGQYCLNMLRELACLQNERRDFEITVYQSRKERRSPLEWLELREGAAFKKRALWTPPHNRFEQLALPLELLPGGPQVFHSPDFIPPLRRYSASAKGLHRVASVITIHDLAFMLFPDLLTEESKRYYGQIRQAVTSADRIITVSESTARDVVERLGVGRDKIRVVYEAANSLYKPFTPQEIEAVAQGEAAGVAKKLAAAGLDSQASFLLFVSTIEPRKNLPLLLKAFRAALDSLPAEVEKPRLVLAGREGWLFEQIYQQAEELKLQSHLVWLGGVDSSDLLYLYNRAACLLMPSLYEGFGLPPLEALACGCPVVVADTSSLPEVVGKLGETLPAEDVEAWKSAVVAYWQGRAENKKRALAEGPAWAARFSWRRAAEETLAVYFEAAETLHLK